MPLPCPWCTPDAVPLKSSTPRKQPLYSRCGDFVPPPLALLRLDLQRPVEQAAEARLFRSGDWRRNFLLHGRWGFDCRLCRRLWFGFGSGRPRDAEDRPLVNPGRCSDLICPPRRRARWSLGPLLHVGAGRPVPPLRPCVGRSVLPPIAAGAPPAAAGVPPPALRVSSCVVVLLLARGLWSLPRRGGAAGGLFVLRLHRFLFAT